MDNKLQKADVQQIPPWVRHFMLHVVKRCCMTIVAWIDQMNEASKAPESVEYIGANGRK